MLPSSSPTTRRAGIPASGPPFQAADLSPSHSPLNPELPEPPLRSEIRDHVRISSETGTAEDRAKFDRESVTPAAQWSFPLRMIYEGDGEEDDELILLSEALRALEQKELTVGGNAGIGFGRLELTGPTVRAFSRRTASGLLAFLRSRYPVPGAVVEAASLVFAFPKPKAPIELNQPAPWNTLTFEIKLRCNGPLLIKAPKGIVKLEPDSTYLTKAGSNEPYVPGSSLRGVLRHRAHKICASQRLTSDLVSTLFGSAKGDGSGTRGLVKIEDGGVSPNEGVCSDHVAIDRITHAAAEKFDNRALDSPAVSFRIHAPFSESVEHRAAVALLLLLVRDLLAEPCAIAIGSQTSRGYGSIESAALQLVEGSFCLGLAGKAPKYGVEQRGARTSFTAKGESKVFDDLCALFDPAWQEICGRKTAP
jgi:CRISPR/Cas system CSM-associated protein Csm3 (group 7 of RAMP superfamily)